MIFIACSIEFAFKSFIFFSAISRTCALVTEPTISLTRQLRTAFDLRGLLQEVGPPAAS